MTSLKKITINALTLRPHPFSKWQDANTLELSLSTNHISWTALYIAPSILFLNEMIKTTDPNPRLKYTKFCVLDPQSSKMKVQKHLPWKFVRKISHYNSHDAKYEQKDGSGNYQIFSSLTVVEILTVCTINILVIGEVCIRTSIKIDFQYYEIQYAL